MPDQKKLEELATKMVHDVRTPLTVLNMLFTTFSARLKDSPEAKEELNIMKEEIAKINDLVTNYKEKLKQL